MMSKNILNKYGLKREYFRGFRKIVKRRRAGIEISKIELRNEELWNKAEEVALEKITSPLIVSYLNAS